MKNIIMMIKKMMIKKMIKKVWNFFEKLGCVRAADSLARQGFHEEAEVLMLSLSKQRITDEKYDNNDKKNVEFFRKAGMCQSSR
jgi:hypothetical protein